MKNIYLAGVFLFASIASAAGKQQKFDVVSVTLTTVNNEIAFDKHEIRAKAKSKIRIRFVNTAEAKSEILHDIAVLKPGSLDEIMQTLQKNGYDVDKVRQHPSILAVSKLLKPGDEDTLELNSLAPGTYPFVCLMPGHGDMLGMKGQIIVTP